MGNNEAATPPKSDIASSSVQEQPASSCPDWAAMQAYYGLGVPMPPPYFSATAAPGHVPHPFMWGPQHLIPAYGTSYAAIYPHGVVYSYPGVPLGSHAQGISSFPTTSEAVAVTTPLSVEPLPKSPSNKDRGLIKKLKGFDGLAVSTGSGNAANMGGDMNGLSQSDENGVDGSSGGSGDDTETESSDYKIHRKGVSGDTLASGNDKVHALDNSIDGGEEKVSSNMSLGVAVTPADNPGKPVSTVASSNSITRMDFRLSSTSNVKVSDAAVPSPPVAMDDMQLKRERRKQSNRESARRSRLRKLAETEELALEVEKLNVENMNLMSEISQLRENSAKLRLENSSLMETLMDAQLGEAEAEEMIIETETQSSPSIVEENFLSKIDNSTSPIARQDDERHMRTPIDQLRQLLDIV